MTAVDRLGFHVRLRSGERVHGARIAFPREVRDAEEVRAVLVEMVRAARNADNGFCHRIFAESRDPLAKVRYKFKITMWITPNWRELRMIYSRSAEYAIRAFVHLAQVPEGKYAMVKNIAEQEDIPAHFLAKILQQLARKGLLRSSKGPTGGFALRVPPEDVKLWDIVEALDGMSQYTAAPAACRNAPTRCLAPCTIAGWPSVRVS